MPEISQKDFDALVKKAAKADVPPVPAHKQDEEPPPKPDHVAFLANGDRYEYAGAHPTHVAIGDRQVPVISVWPLA